MSSILFRVHTSDGQHIDVTAETPDAARRVVRDKQPAVIITKIKVVKGE